MGKYNTPKTTSKSYFSEEDQLRIANAIAKAEMTTSGEIRIFVEDTCPYPQPLERAQEIFHILKIDQTEHRNGVLIYLSLVDKKAALFGDEGIYQKTGQAAYWEAEFEVFKDLLSHGMIVEAIERVIADIGFSLAEYFPYQEGIDKNELPDEMVFGEDIV